MAELLAALDYNTLLVLRNRLTDVGISTNTSLLIYSNDSAVPKTSTKYQPYLNLHTQLYPDNESFSL